MGGQTSYICKWRIHGCFRICIKRSIATRLQVIPYLPQRKSEQNTRNHSLCCKKFSKTNSVHIVHLLFTGLWPCYPICPLPPQKNSFFRAGGICIHARTFCKKKDNTLIVLRLYMLSSAKKKIIIIIIITITEKPVPRAVLLLLLFFSEVNA